MPNEMKVPPFIQTLYNFWASECKRERQKGWLWWCHISVAPCYASPSKRCMDRGNTTSVKNCSELHRVLLRLKGQLWSSGVRKSGIFWNNNTELFEMIVGVLTTCYTQYTWDRSICVFLFDRTTLQVFVTYLTGALYVHPFDSTNINTIIDNHRWHATNSLERTRLSWWCL